MISSMNSKQKAQWTEIHTNLPMCLFNLSFVPAMEFRTSLEKDVSTEFACFIAVWL